MLRINLLLSTLLVLLGCNSTTAPPSDQAQDVPQFMSKAQTAFRKAPAGVRLSAQDLSLPSAFGRDWKLNSMDAWGEETLNIRELVFVAKEPFLTKAKAKEIVMCVKVFKDAATAREWILKRAFSGSAPSEYLLKRATKHFGEKTMPGDFAFGPEMFVRGNVVVEYGSDITLPVSEAVDAVLVELQKTKESANK